MKVSVVIPAYNEEEYIGACLESILRQDEKADEVIVVDNHSTDRTRSIVQRYPVRIVDEPEQGIIPARNRGFDEAQYDIIARLDADSKASPDWIRTIKLDFKNKDIDAVGGFIGIYDLKRKWMKEKFFSFIFFIVKKTLHQDVFFGSNMSLRKEVWTEVKPYLCNDEQSIHEDIDLAIHLHKLNKKIIFDPSLTVYTSGRGLKRYGFYDIIGYPVKFIKTVMSHR